MELNSAKKGVVMKKLVLVGLAFLICCLATECFSQDEDVEVRGFMVQSGVSDTFGNIGLLAGGRYWNKYLGADFNLGISRYSLDVNGTDISKNTAFAISPALLVGFPIGQFKPHLRLGFSYTYTKDSTADYTLKTLDLEPSLCVDFAVTKHFLLGVDVVSFPFVLWGKYNGRDVGGNSIDFLNAFRVAYIF